MDVVTQLIGFAGLVVNVISFQQKDRKKLLYLSMVVCVLMSLHFFLLGAYTASAMFFVALFRAYLFSRYEGDERPYWPVILMLVLFISFAILTWEGIISLLPMISTVFVTIGLWQTDTQRVRKFVLVGPVLWITHNAIVGSIAGVINEVVSLTSVVVGLWRHRKKDLAIVQENAETTP